MAELQVQDYKLLMFTMVQIIIIGLAVAVVLVMVQTKTALLEELVAVAEVEFLEQVALVQVVLVVVLL